MLGGDDTVVVNAAGVLSSVRGMRSMLRFYLIKTKLRVG